MAVGVRYYTPNQFEIDQNGVPLAGAQLFFYQTGTSNLQATYSDVNLTTANTNPVIADANGRFGSIFLITTNAYKVQLWTAPTALNPTGSQIWSEDPCGPAAGGAQTVTASFVGDMRFFAGPAGSIPSLWYVCAGQAVNRSVFSLLFAVLGTSWGAGDGSTTFNLPDFRGRVPVGLDNMGGIAANRITAGVSGINGTTLGAVGGDQNIQQHTHALTDPGHVHTITDPGHAHTEQIGQGVGGANDAWNFTASGSSLAGTNFKTVSATTGITLVSATTSITLATFGSGAAANVQPSGMGNWIIYAGV